MNVKLSDYGISAFATPQGVVGEVGTPGFQAPEMRPGCPYDAKVYVFIYNSEEAKISEENMVFC